MEGVCMSEFSILFSGFDYHEAELLKSPVMDYYEINKTVMEYAKLANILDIPVKVSCQNGILSVSLWGTNVGIVEPKGDKPKLGPIFKFGVDEEVVFKGKVHTIVGRRKYKDEPRYLLSDYKFGATEGMLREWAPEHKVGDYVYLSDSFGGNKRLDKVTKIRCTTNRTEPVIYDLEYNGAHGAHGWYPENISKFIYNPELDRKAMFIARALKKRLGISIKYECLGNKHRDDGYKVYRFTHVTKTGIELGSICCAFRAEFDRDKKDTPIYCETRSMSDYSTNSLKSIYTSIRKDFAERFDVE